MMTDSTSCNEVDLRGTPCPVNFIRCRLAIEELEPYQALQIVLDRGEPEAMVIPALEAEGHQVEIIQQDTKWLKLLVISSVR